VSEVYWVWSGEITDAAELSGLMQAQAGIRPGWVDELHWLFASLAQSGNLVEDFPTNLPHFRWEMPGMQDCNLLQSAGRAVMLEQSGLVVIVEEKRGRFAALALASPRAVGRYNLLPRARLIFLPSLQLRATPEQAAARLLEPVQLSLDQVTWLADPKEPEAAGALGLVNELVNKLDASKGNYALLASLTPQGLALGSLVERI
jgi:hypothetical protein